MGTSPETGPETDPTAVLETQEYPVSPLIFVMAAKALMVDHAELARSMWRAMLQGEGGVALKVEAKVSLREMFWEMIDGAMTYSNGRMVEELIMEDDPDYREHMGLPDRPGFELDFALPKSMYDILGSPDRPEGQ